MCVCKKSLNKPMRRLVATRNLKKKKKKTRRFERTFSVNETRPSTDGLKHTLSCVTRYVLSLWYNVPINKS